MSETLPTRVSRLSQSAFGLAPFRALRDEMDQLMSRFTHDWNGGGLLRDFNPALDLSETADALEIRMDVPGMKSDDISIEVSGNNIRISGERKAEKEEKGKSYHRIERSVGKFCESMTLPCTIKDDKVQAEFRDGVLTIHLPKSEEAKTHKVKIKANGNAEAKK